MVMPRLYKLAETAYATAHEFSSTARRRADAFGGLWHTVVVAGLGAGGRGYFALDVTIADPVPMWEIAPTRRFVR